METSASTRPVGYPGNGLATNTAVPPSPGALRQRAPLEATAVQRHGLEDDRELYERVIQRIRTSGETVRVEEVLGQLDECATAQPDPD